MKLPSYVKKAIDILENNKFEAYVVGGAVRDHLLRRKPNDYDISTNARPEEIKKAFVAYHTLDTGIKHGTVSVFLNRRQVEITTYRSESEYSDFRHPGKVTFVSALSVDLGRRDFTINALAYNRKVIDIVGGLRDLKGKTIRAIGEARQRFSEDPLRILRGLRFAAELGFTIEKETRTAIFTYAPLLEWISAERINIEFTRLIASEKAPSVLTEYFPVIKVFIPELVFCPVAGINALGALAGPELRLAAFLLSLGGKALPILKRLKYRNAAIRNIMFLINNFDLPFSDDEKTLTGLLLQYDYNALLNLLALKLAFENPGDGAYEALTSNRNNLTAVYKNRKYFRINELHISGRDLLAIGYEEGAGIRATLSRLLKEVASGNIANEKKVLIRAAEAIKKDEKHGLPKKTSY